MTPSETRVRPSAAEPDPTPTRPAVRFAAGPSPSDPESEEFRTFLRRRLLVLAAICFGFILLFEGILTPFQLEDNGGWKYLLYGWAITVGSGVLAAVLWRWRSASLRALRWLELAGILGLAGYLTIDLYERLFEWHDLSLFTLGGYAGVGYEVTEPDGSHSTHYWKIREWMVWAVTHWLTLKWVLLVVAYGLLVPNTWRRAAAVTVGLTLVPTALICVGAFFDPLMYVHLRTTGIIVLGTVVIMGFASAISIAGSYRVDRLRKQLASARQLGQYRLTERLGAGGMGEVYRAEHVLLRRPCAVKLIRPDRAGDPTTLARFEREVRATATLTNWHTVEIFDFGHTADGTFYYVMEYLPGLTLDELVKAGGPLPPGRAVHILRQLCVALREAHGIGLIHRDVKPGNVIVGERGGTADVAKLLDFGLVRHSDLTGDAEKLTATGAVLGTPAYMAPEQAGEEGEVTAAADIYSLGAVGYYLLTGRPPFAGKTPLKMVAAHLHEPVPPPRGVRPDLPADVEAVVLRCLEKDPAKRFTSTEELERALAGCACADAWSEAESVGWWREHHGK